MTKYTIGSIICLLLALFGALSAAAFYSLDNAFEWGHILRVIYMIALPLYAHHLANELDSHTRIFNRAMKDKEHF